MKKPKRPSRNTEWGQWANEVMDWIEATMVQPSPTVEATRTTRGTFLKAAPVARRASQAEGQWRGAWDPEEDYVVDDVVIVDDTPSFNIYSHPGLYVCIADIAGDSGNDEPGVDITHWYPYGRLWHDRIIVRSGQIIIDGGGAGGSSWPQIRMLGDGTSFIEIDSGELPGTAYEMKVRHLVLSNDGGATFFQAYFLCTEPIAYP